MIRMKSRTETGMPIPDRLTTFIAAGGWGAIVAGAAMVISLLVDWLVVPYEKLGVAAAYLTASYLVSSSLRLFSTILLLWALLALYRRQSAAAGTFGLWSFAVAFFSTALLGGEVWAEVFAWPTLGQLAPNVFTGSATDIPILMTGKNGTFYLFSIAMILFGVTMWKARAYPRWVAGLLIVSIPATVVLPNVEGTFWESIGQIMFGSAVMILGWHTLRRTKADADVRETPYRSTTSITSNRVSRTSSTA
jgi:hypothetical protein